MDEINSAPISINLQFNGSHELKTASIPHSNSLAIFSSESQVLKIVQWGNIPDSRKDFLKTSLVIYKGMQESFFKATEQDLHGSAAFSNGKRNSSFGLKDPQSTNGSSFGLKGGFPASPAKFKKSSDIAEEPKPDLKAASAAYQSALFAYARSCKDDEESMRFTGIHTIWHLAHIVCFDGSKDPCSFDISCWMQLNLTQELTFEFNRISKLALPALDPLFWPFIHTCVLRGFFGAVESLLVFLVAYTPEINGSKSDIAKNPIFIFKSLVKQFPKLNDYSSNATFKTAWTKWNQDASFLYDNGNLGTFEVISGDREQFAVLFGIMAGVQEIITENSRTWQDALIGMLHFVHPMYDVGNLGRLAGDIKKAFLITNILDKIQISLLERDLGLTIALCAQFDWWLVTHLVDLLEKSKLLVSGSLELAHLPLAVSISEWYMVEFSEYLFAIPDLWKTAAEYLLNCPKSGRSILEEIIPRLPLIDPIKTELVLLFCSENGILEARKTILRVLGRFALKSKLYSQAILRYLDSDDLHLVAYIVDELMDIYIKTGDNSYEAVIRSLPEASFFRSKRLAFLNEYCQFQKHCKKLESKEATDLIVSIFTSGYAPKKFWRHLLLDTLPLLNDQFPYFSVDQVLELMRCAETCALNDQANIYQPSLNSVLNNVGLKEDAYEAISYALSKSMAMAIKSLK